LDMGRFENLGVIKNPLEYNETLLNEFESTIHTFKVALAWSKPQIVELFHKMIPGFGHKETGKYLDGKM
jgi:hypothetical protein